MGYYVRVFCTIKEIPTLDIILEWTKSQGYELKIANGVKDNSMEWEEVEFTYKQNKLPVVYYVYKDEELLEEIEEFIELVTETKGAVKSEKKKVLQHLRSTKYMIVCKVHKKLDDELNHAISSFLEYFETYCEGMIQIDEKGFYEGNDVILELI